MKSTIISWDGSFSFWRFTGWFAVTLSHISDERFSHDVNQVLIILNEQPHDKTNKMTCASAQSDLSLHCALNRYLRAQFFHADREDSEQTGQMPRLIWVFAGCTGHFDGFVMRQLKSFFQHPQLYAIWTWLPTRYAVCQPLLLYTSEEHGTSLVTLYSRVENYQPTVIVIKNTEDEVCGKLTHMSRRTTKLTKWHVPIEDSGQSEDSDQTVHPPSLIRVFAIRMKKAWSLSYPLSTQRDSDQTGQMPRLIWVFTGDTYHFVGFVMGRLIYDKSIFHLRGFRLILFLI